MISLLALISCPPSIIQAEHFPAQTNPKGHAGHVTGLKKRKCLSVFSTGGGNWMRRTVVTWEERGHRRDDEGHDHSRPRHLFGDQPGHHIHAGAHAAAHAERHQVHGGEDTGQLGAVGPGVPRALQHGLHGFGAQHTRLKGIPRGAPLHPPQLAQEATHFGSTTHNKNNRNSVLFTRNEWGFWCGARGKWTDSSKSAGLPESVGRCSSTSTWIVLFSFLQTRSILLCFHMVLTSGDGMDVYTVNKEKGSSWVHIASI